MEKKWTYNGIEYVMRKCGYGKYTINGKYCTDSEVWDWCDDDSNQHKHNEAMKMAESYIRDSIRIYNKEDFSDLYIWCFQYSYGEDIEEFQEGYYEELNTADSFEKLIETGVFHDAIGKVIDYGVDFVTVTTEY